MGRLANWWRWRVAWWAWFLETPPLLDRRARRFIPRDPFLRREQSRIWRERWRAREPKPQEYAEKPKARP